jgi:hypothetical protein
MTLTDQQVLDIVNASLDREGVSLDRGARVGYLLAHRDIPSLRALGPLVDRYLEIVNPPRLCQVTHDHWEGPMICGNKLPCPRHGGR